MGDEYTWLVGLDEQEDIKAIKCSIERNEVEQEQQKSDEEAVLVNTLRNEDITPTLYSEFLSLQDRVRGEDRHEKDLNRYDEEIDSIEPYKGPEDRLSLTKFGPTHSLMDLRPTADTESPSAITSNVIQIGDRTYAITSALFISIKESLGQSMETAEVFTRESFSTVSAHSESVGRSVGHHLVNGAAALQKFATVQIISAVIRESCHFTIDRSKMLTKWYITSVISDDPETVYRKSIRNTSSISRPDCATTSLKLNSAVVKRRAMFSTISWLDRRVLWVTRDDGMGDVTRNVKKILLPSSSSSDIMPTSPGGSIEESTPPPYFEHCQSINQSPSQTAFSYNNAYDPIRGPEEVRPTASATANYFDLLDALMSSAFNHKRSSDSAEAYAILIDMITPPEFEEKSSCAGCYETFSISLFRHHCRNCGRSVCGHCCSPKSKRIPKYGYTDPVRVCFPCAIKVEAEATMERVQWRLLRIRDHLHNQLIPFFSHGVDRGIDKANRVVDLGLFMLKSALMCNYPAMLIVETVDILKRYGMSGLAGVLMRNDFVEAVETLKKISGMDKHYPISLSELTACIYYRLAIERGIRGSDPDGEYKLHFPDMEPDEAPYSSELPLETLDTIIDYASMALMLVYEENAVECQRIAATQGYSCICAETISGAEKPAFGIFVSNATKDKENDSSVVENAGSKLNNSQSGSDESVQGFDFKMHRSKPKEVVLAVRGTLSIHDVVTDIRAAPHPFPPSQEDILSLIYQGNDLNLEGKEKERKSPDDDIGEDRHSTGGSEVEEEDSKKHQSRQDTDRAGDWEWLMTSSTKTYVATGMFRSACWLLSEVGRPLLELMNHGYKLVVCGHSLGGGVAAIFTYMLHEIGITNIHCYAYSPPSFVDAETADKMSAFVTTTILHDDIIPRVTPQSIRILMKDVLFFRSEVFKYLEQDWKDAIQRAAAIWVPRSRDADKIQTKNCQNQDMDRLQEKKSLITAGADGNESEEEETGEDHISQYLIVLEEEIIPLWCPGKIVHIYSQNGVYDAAYVPRSFPNLRKIIVQGNIFRDHSGQSIFEGLQEVRAARTSPCPPPQWTPYNDPSTQGVCKCCQSRFTWHSTFRGEAQEYKERYNCRSCGALVCGPCSTNRQPILRLGLITPSRVCDTCFYNGIYSSDKNPD